MVIESKHFGKRFDCGKEKKTPSVCHRCGQKQVMMELTIAADLSHTGQEVQKQMPVDACIADIVRAFNEGGIKTLACCCGHGDQNGYIALMDKRRLTIRKY